MNIVRKPIFALMFASSLLCLSPLPAQASLVESPSINSHAIDLFAGLKPSVTVILPQIIYWGKPFTAKARVNNGTASSCTFKGDDGTFLGTFKVVKGIAAGKVTFRPGISTNSTSLGGLRAYCKVAGKTYSSMATATVSRGSN